MYELPLQLLEGKHWGVIEQALCSKYDWALTVESLSGICMSKIWTAAWSLHDFVVVCLKQSKANFIVSLSSDRRADNATSMWQQTSNEMKISFVFSRMAEQPVQAREQAPNMSLDQFTSKFTSADNASFDEIMEGINKRHREKHAWLYRAIEQKKVKLAKTVPYSWWLCWMWKLRISSMLACSECLL